MKTKIIISKDWRIIKEYDFLFTMTIEDVVQFEGIEYRVYCCVLEVENDTMSILVQF